MLITRGHRRRTLRHELIAADLGGTFACRRFVVSHWELNWHRHPELELTLIVRGEGLRYVGDSVAEFAAGDLVLLGPGVPHSWSSRAHAARTCESLVAQFPADLLGPGWADAAEARPLTTLFARAGHGLHVTGVTATAVRAELLQAAATAPGPLRLGLLLTALGRLVAAPAADCQLIARLPAGGAVPRPASGGVRPTAARGADPWAELVRHLDAHAGGPLALGALAARMGLSPASFARAFRRRFGTTCTAYLTRIRLAQACRGLLESAQPVAAVAFAAGFANLANFNRRFKAAYGCTPRDYRRRHAAA